MTERGEEMLRMYEQGYSMSQIAEAFKISRQRVHQIIGSQRDRAHYGELKKQETRQRFEEASERMRNGSSAVEEAERMSITVASLRSALSRYGLTLPRPPIPHGTYYRYTLGCRCPECKEAAREMRRQRIERGPNEHGTYSAYTNYGCRCPECKKASYTVQKEYRKRRKERLRKELGNGSGPPEEARENQTLGTQSH